MRAAWPWLALIVTIIAAFWLSRPSGPRPDPAAGNVAVGDILLAIWPSVLGAIAIPAVFAIASHGAGWRGASGMAVASRASLGVGLLALLGFLSAAFWAIHVPEPSPRVYSFGLHGAFLPPLFCIPVGAAFFDWSMTDKECDDGGTEPDASYSNQIGLQHTTTKAATATFAWSTTPGETWAISCTANVP